MISWIIRKNYNVLVILLNPENRGSLLASS